jgi:hypothetical protein
MPPQSSPLCVLLALHLGASAPHLEILSASPLSQHVTETHLIARVRHMVSDDERACLESAPENIPRWT